MVFLGFPESKRLSEPLHLMAAGATSIRAVKVANGARIRKIVMAFSQELIFTS